MFVTQLSLDKMVGMLQTAFLSAFSWMQIIAFLLKFLVKGLFDNKSVLAPTNDDPVHWHIYESSCPCDLNIIS